MQIVLPDTMVHNGQRVDITPSCPHNDGTWREKEVGDKYNDKLVRLKDEGNSRIIVATRNLTNGSNLDEEVLKSMPILSLKQIFRKATKEK
jgi:hypothetical protein